MELTIGESTATSIASLAFAKSRVPLIGIHRNSRQIARRHRALTFH
jgi:hypothetical protein